MTEKEIRTAIRKIEQGKSQGVNRMIEYMKPKALKLLAKYIEEEVKKKETRNGEC